MKDTTIPQSISPWILRGANLTSTLLLWVALGGANLAAPWADCRAADLVVWSQGPNLPLVYDEIRAAVLNGKLYVVGGRTGQGGGNTCVNTVLVYDPGNNQWSSAAPLPEKLGAVGLAAQGGYLYCFGGINEPYWWGRPVASAYRYNPTNNSWTRLADMPIARSNFGIGVIGDKIYCAGGNTHWPNATSRVDSYDTASNSWATIANLPETRGSLLGGTWAGKLVVAMGLADAFSPESKTVFVYDPQSMLWSQLTASAAFGQESGSLFADSSGLYCMGKKDSVTQPACISRLHPDTGQVDFLTPSSPLVQEGILAQAYDPVRGVCYGVGGWTTSRDSTFQLATISTGQSVATNFYWIITRGRDAQTAKAIYTLTPDGSNSAVFYQPVGLGPSQYITAPVLRADGRLAFHLSTSGDCGPLFSGQLHTDQVLPLAETYLDTPCGGITWVPGRDEVLFSNYGSGVHRMDLDPRTQDERRLTTGMYDEVNLVTTQGVVYAAGPANPGRMFTFDLNGGSVQPWDPFNNGMADWAFLSADQRLVAIRQQVPPAGSSLTVRQSDGNPVPGSPTPLVGGADVSLGTLGGGAFSPDGQTFCFQRDQDLWSINIDGTSLRQLTHGEYPLPQVWGARLVVEPLRLSIAMVNKSAALTISGPVGANVALQYSTNLANPDAWSSWASFPLPISPFTVIDSGTSNSLQRFYRAFTSR
jgi:N-acetylneuraminic acid mutarotase